MQFNLMIIGDEILYGSRQDKHFDFFKTLLARHGLRLGMVQYLPDEKEILVRQLKRSFADGLPTFVTGGIGATPDDHTRQAAAEALGLAMAVHPVAAGYIDGVTLQRGEALDSDEHKRRLEMANFPVGAELVENAYNTIAGFSIREHYFLPGFPVMAQPMAEWVLNRYYADRFNQVESMSRSIWLFGLPESRIGDLMERIERDYAGVKTFSLPCEQTEQAAAHIEFGVKASGEACVLIDAAWQDARSALEKLGGRLQEVP
ncbi:MAG: molybdopterin-binding protein [Neisseria sp.]|uniref:competence/damage-inducible protein A n=1 Tax=Neisseria sp. TaxID=192066 RepID=UPI0026DBEDAE|nr:molybdopterin-binding protein [Neisseria sp.]MDO4641367.1 molybdopterin-binding protein [Neisseria sp.]